MALPQTNEYWIALARKEALNLLEERSKAATDSSDDVDYPPSRHAADLMNFVATGEIGESATVFIALHGFNAWRARYDAQRPVDPFVLSLEQYKARKR